MNKSVRNLLLLLTGAAAVAVTLVIFFVGFRPHIRTLTDFIALSFVLLAEILWAVGTALVTNARQNRLLVIAGVETVLTLYLLGAILLAVLRLPLIGLRAQITSQSLLLAGTAVLTACFMAITLSVQSRQPSNPLTQSENIIKTLAGTAALVSLSPSLTRLTEALHYAEPRGVSPELDQQITASVQALSGLLSGRGPQDLPAQAADQIEAILLLLRQRSQLVSQQNRGSF